MDGTRPSSRTKPTATTLSSSRRSTKTDVLGGFGGYSGSVDGSFAMGPYGLRRVDYTKVPKAWPLPPHPPPPGNLLNRNLPYVLGGAFLATVLYLYLNPDEEVFEYWKAIERGESAVPPSNDADLDDDDDDDDLDLEENEWADDDDKSKKNTL